MIDSEEIIAKLVTDKELMRIPEKQKKKAAKPKGKIILIAHEQKLERLHTWRKRSKSMLIRVMQITTVARHAFT